MEKLLKIGITQGDINGIGYEVILKTLADPRMLELCIPVIYGSSKAIGYYKKLLELDHLSINIVKSADEAGAGYAGCPARPGRPARRRSP